MCSPDLELPFLTKFTILSHLWAWSGGIQVQKNNIMLKNQSKFDCWYPYHNSWQSSWFHSYSEDLEPLFLPEIVIFCYFRARSEALQGQMDDLTDDKCFRWYQTHSYHSLSQSRWFIWNFMDLGPPFLTKLSIFSYIRAKNEAVQVQYDESIGLDQLTFDWRH